MSCMSTCNLLYKYIVSICKHSRLLGEFPISNNLETNLYSHMIESFPKDFKFERPSLSTFKACAVVYAYGRKDTRILTLKKRK